jgi:Predicted Zn-dependent protease (DUF2268)
MHTDPAQARLVTDDIPRFWQAFDAAMNGADPQATFERSYLELGTPGLQDFRQLRADQVANLAKVVLSHRMFYASIRQTTLQFHQRSELSERVLDIYRKMADLVPGAKFPDTTLLIGALGTGGCPAPSGNLIGTEFFSKGPDMLTDELSAWQRINLRGVEDLPFMIAHEYAHLLQAPEHDGESLLGLAIREGSADLIASLATGETPRGAHFEYGPEHEPKLWTEFQTQMHGTELSNWLYQGDRAVDRPADLGYFIGHQIVQAYYKRAADKHQAVADILNIYGPQAFLAASGYAP